MALAMAYNLEANGKRKRGHPPIIKALAKAYRGKFGDWPKLLPYALWADCTTHSFVTEYMPFELMYGQKPIMPIQRIQFFLGVVFLGWKTWSMKIWLL